MKPLTVGSTFTGIGGADLGFEWAGFDIKWQCEFDSWKQQVLRAHWPDVPLYDDITTMLDPPPVDILIGGFPCQDLSVAGQRKGFTGERSILAFEFLRLAESIRPKWIVLENVPGLLSSSQGADFARLIDEVVACGYGVAWRILDARFFGVPQRRRRVFIVARRTDALVDSREASRLALRALRESGSGDIAAGWQSWQETARGTREGAPGGCVCEPDPAGSLTKRYGKGVNSTLDDGSIVISDGGGLAFRKSRRAASMTDDETWVDGDHANTLNRFDVGDTRTTHIIVNALDRQQGGADDNSAQAGHLVAETITAAFMAGQGSRAGGQVVPFDTNFSNQATPGGDISATLDTRGKQGVAVSPTLTKHNLDSRSPQSEEQQRIVGAVHEATTSVRRLTPVECERLMGLPDGWTAPEGVKAPDSKRYAACGDAIVTTVAFWIADRIRMIEEEEAS